MLKNSEKTVEPKGFVEISGKSLPIMACNNYICSMQAYRSGDDSVYFFMQIIENPGSNKSAF